MATYKIKKKTANGSTEEILLPISSIDGLQTALNNAAGTSHYWANVAVSKTSSKTTTPTFGSVKIGDAVTIQYDSSKKAVKFVFD